MPYPYPQYTDGPDAESHIRAFVSTWQANHFTQRLTTTKIESSKIAEFTLSLDGPTARWYSRLDPGEFAMFQDVHTQFLELFHREVPKKFARIAPSVFYHQPRTTGDSRPVHDPVL